MKKSIDYSSVTIRKNVLSKYLRKKEIEKIFSLFYRDVRVREWCGYDFFVECSGVYLMSWQIQEAVFHDGLDLEVEKASYISHFINAYLFARYGVTVEIPTQTQKGYKFYIHGAYRDWERK